MEKSIDLEQQSLINELNQGRELANQLINHLDPITSRETCEFLVDQILSSYDKALSMLHWSGLAGETLPPLAGMIESPHSISGTSSKSEGSASDHECKGQSHKDVYKKRKTLPRWSQQVRVCQGTGLEGPLDDGYSWRKYGQKDILGAKFPRAYYRCTHRHAQGCLATKQVQRSDEDPSVFEVTYRGRHTCIRASQLVSLEKEGSKQNMDQNQPQEEEEEEEEEEIQRKSQEMLFNFGTGLMVKTDDFATKEIFPSFSFPSTPIECEIVESHFFSESMMENKFMDSYSPPFKSPATSESNYFSLSPCQMNNFGMGYNMPSSESDLTEIISAPTSVTNSPIGDLDVPLDQVDFDPNFPFDNPEFFT